MRPIYLTYPAVTATFNTDPIVLDQYISPGNAAVTIAMTGGTGPSASVVLQYTTDNVLDPNVTNYLWQPFAASPFSAAGAYTFNTVGAVEGIFTYAPKAVRVQVTAVAGSPTIAVQVIQVGIGGT